jgi:hypothetical protein
VNDANSANCLLWVKEMATYGGGWKVLCAAHNLGELFTGVPHLLIGHLGKEGHTQSSLAGALGMRETARS